MIPLLIAVASYVVLLGCEGRPRSLSKKEGDPDVGVTHGNDGGLLALDTFDAGTADAGASDAPVKTDAGDAGAMDASQSFDAGVTDAGVDAGIIDAGDIFDAGASVADAGDAGAGRADAGFADAGDAFDAGSVPMLACQDLEVLLDEVSCVTDPQTTSLFGNELPRKIKVTGFSVDCPSREVLLNAASQPLFISLMADRASIPALQSNPDASLSPFAEDFINTINGVHNLVPADGFVDGAVGVWRPEPNLNSGPFIFDATIDGFNLIYGMPGYSCNYQVSSPWELN